MYFSHYYYLELNSARKLLDLSQPSGVSEEAAEEKVRLLAQKSGIELEEEQIPVRGEVKAACELLGLDPLYCANEGKLLCVTAPEDAERVLAAMLACPEGKNAARIGRVTDGSPGKVTIRTPLGGRRMLQKLSGAQLPRIC